MFFYKSGFFSVAQAAWNLLLAQAGLKLLAILLFLLSLGIIDRRYYYTWLPGVFKNFSFPTDLEASLLV